MQCVCIVIMPFLTSRIFCILRHSWSQTFSFSRLGTFSNTSVYSSGFGGTSSPAIGNLIQGSYKEVKAWGGFGHSRTVMLVEVKENREEKEAASSSHCVSRTFPSSSDNSVRHGG